MWLQKVPGGGVVALAYSPDGRTLYTLDGGGWVTAWDVPARTGRRLYQVVGGDRYMVRHLAITCDGRFLVLQGGFLRVWDLAAGAEHQIIRGGQFAALHARLDPTAPRLVSPDGQGEALISWDIPARELGPVLVRANPARKDRFGEFDLSPDGRSAVVLTARQEAILFDRADGREVFRFQPWPADSWGRGLLFSPDGTTLVLFGRDDTRLWDVGSRAVRVERVAGVWHGLFAFHPTAPVFVARNAEGGVTLFGLGTGEPIRSLDFALGRYVQCVAFAPDGLTCAVGGSNKQFAVFDVDL